MSKMICSLVAVAFARASSMHSGFSSTQSSSSFSPGAFVQRHCMSAGAGGDVKRLAFFGKLYVLVDQFGKTFAPIGRDE